MYSLIRFCSRKIRKNLIVVLLFMYAFSPPVSTLPLEEANYPTVIRLEFWKMAHCNDENCSKNIKFGRKVMDEQTGWPGSGTNGETYCKLEVQNVWFSWNESVCPSFMNFKIPTDVYGNNKSYSVTLFANQEDILQGTDVITYQRRKNYNSLEIEENATQNRKTATVALPFCTKKIVAQFETCRDDNYDAKQVVDSYVYSWKLRPEFYGVRESTMVALSLRKEAPNLETETLFVETATTEVATTEAATTEVLMTEAATSKTATTERVTEKAAGTKAATAKGATTESEPHLAQFVGSRSSDHISNDISKFVSTYMYPILVVLGIMEAAIVVSLIFYLIYRYRTHHSDGALEDKAPFIGPLLNQP